MNIKNPETERLVRDLAAATGESLTGAITVAVRERLQRVGRPGHAVTVERLLTIGRDVASLLPEPYRSADHGDLLYDERGLPR